MKKIKSVVGDFTIEFTTVICRCYAHNSSTQPFSFGKKLKNRYSMPDVVFMSHKYEETGVFKFRVWAKFSCSFVVDVSVHYFLPPIVLSWYSWNCPLTKRSTRLDFPTADSPNNTSLNWQILPCVAPFGLWAPPRADIVLFVLQPHQCNSSFFTLLIWDWKGEIYCI